MPLDEGEIGILEESLISSRLSGPNETLSWNDQSDEGQVSGGDFAIQFPRQKPRRHFTRLEKGKMKTTEYWTLAVTSNQNDSDMAGGKNGPPKMRSKSAERATKSAHPKLR